MISKWFDKVYDWVVWWFKSPYKNYYGRITWITEDEVKRWREFEQNTHHEIDKLLNKPFEEFGKMSWCKKCKTCTYGIEWCACGQKKKKVTLSA